MSIAPDELLQWGMARYQCRFAVVTSFQKEGMVLVDMATKIDTRVRVVTLDTGRLSPETHLMMEQVRQRYSLEIEVVRPDQAEIDSMVGKFGVDLFRDDVAYRKLCCQIRKVRPMDLKLEGVDAYAVGLRREQSESRGNVQQTEETGGKLKLSPLAHWSAADVEAYTVANNVPTHPLYAQGYRSIGCAPCTRAVTGEEGERAGRWWWEVEGDKECGLHFSPEGKVERKLDVLLREVLSARS